MMPFLTEDCYEGMIGYFRIVDLVRHKQIRHTEESICRKARPFVCYAIDEDQLTYWTYFTTVPRPWRPTVSRQWLRTPRDRYLEEVNERGYALESAGKYELVRMLAADGESGSRDGRRVGDRQVVESASRGDAQLFTTRRLADSPILPNQLAA